jgi:PncC family amidohydrolase
MEALTIEARVGAALRARNWLCAAAESCTGGLLLERLTRIAGSSDYVSGGVVAYSYPAKQMLLGVSAQTLAQYGAVSEQVAVQMAEGVRQRLDVDIAVSVTGIAGPDGATADKPLGLTYIGLCTKQGLLQARRYVWTNDRIGNRQASVDAAFAWILEVCEAGE